MLKDASFIQQMQQFLEHKLTRLSFLQNRSDRFWDPISLLFNEYQGSFLGIKQPGREVDHSSPSRAEVNNE
jgi:hypothetical protein